MSLTLTTEPGYGTVSLEDIEEEIRRDLSPIGSPSSISGEVLVVDGDWKIIDGSATVGSRTFQVIRAKGALKYLHDGKVVDIQSFASAYDPSTGKLTIREVLQEVYAKHGYGVQYRNEHEKMFLTGNLFVIALGIPAIMLTALVGLPALLDSTSLTMINGMDRTFGILSGIPGLVLLPLSIVFMFRNDHKLSIFPKTFLVNNPAVREALTRSAVLECSRRNLDFTGSLELRDALAGNMPNGKNYLSLSFEALDQEGNVVTVRVDGDTFRTEQKVHD